MLKPRAQYRRFLWEHSPELAKDFSNPYIRLLVIARQMCGRDLDRALILAVIISRANDHPDYAALDPREIMAGHIDPLPTLPVNTQSIADSTGIPRENVRRKLHELVELGWVCRESSALRLTPLGWRELEPLRQGAITLTMQFEEAVERSLAVHGMVGRQRHGHRSASPP
jgi:hypothetical protein